MTDWLAVLQQRHSDVAAGRPVVRVAVAAVRGSTPREPGATLLAWRDSDGRLRSAGSIGGGHLEARALEIAAQLLADAAGEPAARRVERFALAASLGQCCGGVVELYWERFDAPEGLQALAGRAAAAPWLRGCALDGSGRSWQLTPAEALAAGWPVAGVADGSVGAMLLTQGAARWFVERLGDDATPLWLYGAGHVGRALVAVLAELPFRLTWVDSRPGMLDEAVAQARQRSPGRVIEALSVDAPEDAVADAVEDLLSQAPAGAWHLIMTHSHAEDFRLVEALLRRGEPALLALLGSESKAHRFRQRLRQRGFDEAAIARLVSPIGRGEIASKLPAAIAVAVAAQLLVLRERSQRLPHPHGLVATA